MSIRRIQLVVRIVLIVIPVVTFFWLLAKDFVVTGILETEYDFSRETAFIRQLRLPAKLDSVVYDRATRDYTQTMRVHPVTFDVYLPRNFNRAIVELQYKKAADQKLDLGVQVQSGKWDPRMFPLVERAHTDLWTIGEARIDHLERFDFSKWKYQFVLSAPGLTPEKPGITFTSIRIRFERPAWALDNFFPRVWNFLTRR